MKNRKHSENRRMLKWIHKERRIKRDYLQGIKTSSTNYKLKFKGNSKSFKKRSKKTKKRERNFSKG